VETADETMFQGPVLDFERYGSLGRQFGRVKMTLRA